MQFIKRYKARRSKRKEIAAAYRVITSLRLKISISPPSMREPIDNQIDHMMNLVVKLDKELCKL